MIVLDHITKWYPTWRGRHYVFRDISLTIPSGLNVGLFGPNGAGKSTLLRVIGGIDYPNHGRVRASGSLSWPMGLGGGYQGSMTGRENTRFVCRLYGLTEAQVRETCRFVHEFSELAAYFDMPVQTYSSGMRSRLSFGISMAFEFDYYLIDELTAVGDKRFQEKSATILHERKARSNYLMVSHNVKQLAQEVDIALFVNRGAIHLVEDPQEALRLYEEAA